MFATNDVCVARTLNLTFHALSLAKLSLEVAGHPPAKQAEPVIDAVLMMICDEINARNSVDYAELCRKEAERKA